MTQTINPSIEEKLKAIISQSSQSSQTPRTIKEARERCIEALKKYHAAVYSENERLEYLVINLFGGDVDNIFEYAFTTEYFLQILAKPEVNKFISETMGDYHMEAFVSMLGRLQNFSKLFDCENHTSWFELWLTEHYTSYDEMTSEDWNRKTETYNRKYYAELIKRGELV